MTFSEMLIMTLAWGIAIGWVYGASWSNALFDRTFDPVEAKAKAVFSVYFVLLVPAFWVHWIVGCFALLSSFIMYFWAKSYFTMRRERQTEEKVNKILEEEDGSA